MIEASIAVVAMTPDAAQTVNHNAALTGTAEDSQSGTHGEAIPTTTATTTMAIADKEGGAMETMIDIEEKTGPGTIVLRRREDGEGTRAALAQTADTRADTTKATINATTTRGGGSTEIEAEPTATVRKTETTAIAVSVSVTAATTSAGVLRGGVQPPLAAPVHIPALVHHPPRPRRPKTKPSRISPRRACSRPRRTRSGRRTERARCSSIMSRLRLASRLLGGGFMFLRVMSKSICSIYIAKVRTS
jgi:hypothetical protein